MLPNARASSMVGHSVSMHEALSSIPRTPKGKMMFLDVDNFFDFPRLMLFFIEKPFQSFTEGFVVFYVLAKKATVFFPWLNQ
jgi:hypothetical protein